MIPARPQIQFLAVVCGSALAVGVAACGSPTRSDLIPADAAQSLQERLDSISSKVDGGECGSLPQDLAQLRASLSTLPTAVDDRLRARLAEGVANIVSIAPAQCADAATRNQAPATPPPVVTEVPTTTTAPPPTTTAIEPTTTETMPTTTGTDGTVPPDTGGAPAGTDTGGASSDGKGHGKDKAKKGTING